MNKNTVTGNPGMVTGKMAGKNSDHRELKTVCNFQ
jgi:hypothetical protein